MNWYGAVFHWMVIILIWAAGAIIIHRRARERGVLPALIRLDVQRRDALMLGIGILVVITYEVVVTRMAGLAMPQIWREYQGFQSMYGQQAGIVAVFQNLYYLVEFVLVVMMIALFQRGAELRFRPIWFPWGGVGLALTWGTIHLVTNPQGAVWVITWGVVLGVFFVLSRRSFLTTWIIGVLGFVA